MVVPHYDISVTAIAQGKTGLVFGPISSVFSTGICISTNEPKQIPLEYSRPIVLADTQDGKLYVIQACLTRFSTVRGLICAYGSSKELAICMRPACPR